MKKKIFASALALCMVLTMMPSMAFAEGGDSSENVRGGYLTDNST